MDVNVIIEKYYHKGSALHTILIGHSQDVTCKALSIVDAHPELGADREFISEAAMLHDIGIFMTYAPDIECNGIANYLCHGYLGREIMDSLGYSRHGLVCERHTGTGITLDEIIEKKLPLPHRDMCPQSIEEKIICFADCFFSKTRLGEEKSIEHIRKTLSKFGERSVNQFDEWCLLFL